MKAKTAYWIAFVLLTGSMAYKSYVCLNTSYYTGHMDVESILQLTWGLFTAALLMILISKEGKS